MKDAEEEIGESDHALRSDIGRVLIALEAYQQQRLAETTVPSEAVTLSDTERDEAMELLRDPRLLDRILDDFETCGIGGEHVGKLAGCLAAISQLLDRPLGLVIQSSSAAGKSTLADAVLAFMPPEETFQLQRDDQLPTAVRWSRLTITIA